jgi:hypothetical protein
LPDFEKLVVDVKYDEIENTLTVRDNAFGMEIERFKDALTLDAKNSEQKGRNEFGMGLKTAASWFGNVWTVTSTQYGSDNIYAATVDIPLLKSQKQNRIGIRRGKTDPKRHGTRLVISDVTKKITAPKTKGKIIELLSSMYRRDINNRNIEIRFNGTPISFKEYTVLKFRDKEWKKYIDFNVLFEEKNYRVTGFVAIMEKGSFSKAGFALFRQDRVVIGGSDSNYKPQQIFGQQQSQRSLKLFGELDMNDFPVNQAKDGFVWDDGLEEAFIENLKNSIQDYIKIADISIKERVHESQFSDEKSDVVENKVSTAIENLSGTTEPKNVTALEEPEVDEYVETVLNNSNESVNKKVGKSRSYKVPINPVTNKNIKVEWEIGTNGRWIDSDESDGVVNVKINIDHPFFKPYSNEEEFKIVLEKFVIAFIMAEEKAKATSGKDGHILPSSIRHYMNTILSKMEG